VLKTNGGPSYHEWPAAEFVVRVAALVPHPITRQDFGTEQYSRVLSSQAFHGVRRTPVTGFEKYLIFYVQVPEGIKVVRVIHGSRDIERIFQSGA
jgi:hypothetical protein